MSLEFINSQSPETPEEEITTTETNVNGLAPFTPEQNRLLELSLPLVRPCALRLANDYAVSPHTSEFEEMLSDGYEGLVKGIRKFDTAKLSDHAVTGTGYIGTYISGYITHGLRSRWGRMKVTKIVDGKEVEVDRTTRLKPSVILGTANSLQESTEKMEYGVEQLGMHEKAPEQERFGETSAEEIGFNAELMRILNTYSLLDQEIFIRRFYGDESQGEIAAAVGTSQMNVSRRLRKMYRDLAIRMDLRPTRRAA